MKNLMDYAASMNNPPKGYGLETGFKVAAYRSQRMKHWAKKIGKGYCAEVFDKVEKDIIAKFGPPL